MPQAKQLKNQLKVRYITGHRSAGAATQNEHAYLTGRGGQWSRSNRRKTQGIGISNLRSRVQLVEGNLQYDSVENEGTTAIVRVPV